MNWEMIGAVGEVVGAAGVIASLAYVAAQIRASNRAMREQAAHELLERTQELMKQLTGPGDMAEIFARGVAEFDALNPGEQMKLRGFFLSTVLNWQRFHHLEASQKVEPWLSHTWRGVRRDLLAAPGFRTWFEGRKQWLDQDFLRALEGEIAEVRESVFIPRPDA